MRFVNYCIPFLINNLYSVPTFWESGLYIWLKKYHINLFCYKLIKSIEINIVFKYFNILLKHMNTFEW